MSKRVGLYAGDPLEHPATLAWSSLDPSGARPTAVTILKSSRKSGVYRLHDVVPNHGAVIAKHASRETAAVERRLYEVVLPSLSLSRLDLFGAVDEPEKGLMWLFIQDAGERAVAAEEHVLLAQWLAQLHTTAADGAVAHANDLPERGLDHYRRSLERSCRRLTARIAQWAAPDRALARAVLEQNLALLEQLGARWAMFARLAEVTPRTLAHCDLNRKNVRVRDQAGAPVVVGLDWEMAGWGSPASDLGSLSTSFKVGAPAFAAYASVVQRRWPAFDAAAIERARRVGVVMRALLWIDWDIDSLGLGWDDPPLRRFECYAVRLRSALGPSEGLGLL